MGSDTDSDTEVVVATRISKEDDATLEEVVNDDIQITSKGHLIRTIIRFWAEEQRSQNKTKKGEKSIVQQM